MNKGLIIGIVVVVVLIAAWFLYTNMYPNSVSDQYNQNNNTTGTQNGSQGTVYISVKDAAINMQSVSAVNMTVDKVYMHSQSQGWVTVSQAPQTFSLLALKASGSSALAAKMDVAADTYDQVWFHVSNIMLTESGKVKTATMPSNDFKMNGTVKVVANTNSVATFDVLADQSLHETSKGEIIFTPVVNFKSQSGAIVTVDVNNMVTVTNGNVDSNAAAGMDIDGTVKDNFKLDANTKLQINGGVINLMGSSTTNVNVGN